MVGEASRKRKREEGDVPLRLQVLKSGLPENVKNNLFEDLNKYDSSEKFHNWVRKAMQLPLHKINGGRFDRSEDVASNIQAAKRILDRHCTGHASAKAEVLKMLCESKKSSSQSYAIGLEGPPGCGKTHFVKNALSRALGRPYVSIQMGGCTDSSFLVGSSYTYEGSKEGRIAAALIETGCCNPIIHLDEVDKISKTERGYEVEGILIHLTDPSDPTYRDKYFHDIDIDLSKVTFVLGYNDPSKVNPVLLDRVKRIRMEAPNMEERHEIVHNHILPRIFKKFVFRSPVSLSTEAMQCVLSSCTKEQGMRNIEKLLEHVISSVFLCTVLQPDAPSSASVNLSKEVPIFDEEGNVRVDFAKGVISQIYDLGGNDFGLPPPLMYT